MMEKKKRAKGTRQHPKAGSVKPHASGNPRYTNKRQQTAHRAFSRPRLNSRAVIALALEQILYKGRAIDDALESAFLKVKPADKGIVNAICYGVLRQHGGLQQRINKLLDEQPDDTHPRVQMLLEIGLWQLGHAYAEHASIHQCVDAAEQIGIPKAKGFINALLRRAQKEFQQGSAFIITDSAYCLPTWLQNLIQAKTFSQSLILNHSTRASQLQQQLGDLLAPLLPAISAVQQQQPCISIRLNPNRVHPKSYLQQLQQLGLSCQLGQLPNSIVIDKTSQISELPGFKVGAFCVQDEAAQCAAHILKPQPQTRFLDACAAPGGKTTHLQELAQNSLQLHALEINEFRSRRLRENLGRLRANGKVIIGSASAPDLWWDGRPYQGIMLDAPCSGTGVMRRNPDIPWIRQTEDIIRLSYDSLKMLKRLWHCLDYGGQLLFATCSVLAEENDLVIEQFLQQQHNARLLDFDLPLQHLKTLFGKQVMPSSHADSLYYCLLQKY